MTYMNLVEKNAKPLVDPATIQEIKEAKELAEIIRLVYKQKISLEALIHEMRVQHKEAGENSKIILHTQKGIFVW